MSELTGPVRSDAAPPRPAPELIIVPPPPWPRLWPSSRPSAVLAILLGCVVLALVLIPVLAGPPIGLVLFLLLTAVVVPALLLLAQRRQARKWSKGRQDALNRPRRGNEPLAAALAALWKKPLRAPKTTRIVEVLNRVAPPAGDPAPESTAVPSRIVYFGLGEIPEVGPHFFEPEIITPTQALWRKVILIPITLGLLFFWLLSRVVPNMPAWVGPLLDPNHYWYFYFLGLSALAVWTWRAMIRPTYIRIAPGVIQILEYSFRSGRPRIRSYPLAAGTLVIVTELMGKRPKVELIRGTQQDTLPLDYARGAKQVLERLWQSLLSTAPIPPLSTEELVG